MTLVEILIAVFIITVGLIAVAAGIHLATGGITQGQQETTAAFLAEQRIEDIKAFALSTTDPTRGFGNVTAGNFPAEGYGGIAQSTGYRRTTTITSPTATTKLVTVEVFYVAVGTTTNAERQVTFSTVLARR